MAIATRTFLQIIHGVADALSLRSNGTTTTSTTTNAVYCASYPYKTNRTNADDSLYTGGEIYVTSGTVPTPNPNGISAYAPSTGVFTPSVDYSVAPDVGATFDIYLRDVSVTEIRAAVIEAMRKRMYRAFWPVTIIPDGDMSYGTASTYWTASNATHSRVTTAANLVYGPRSSRVLATSAGGYIVNATNIGVDSANFPHYYIQALCRADVGTARLTVYDVTNGATIKSEDWTSDGWGVVAFEFDCPSGCEEIQVRLTSVANNDDTYWNYVMLLPVGAEEIPLPDWVTQEGQIQMVWHTPISEPVRPMEPNKRPVMWFKIRYDEANPNSAYKLSFYPGANGGLWAQVYRPFDALSADTDTTFMDRNWVELAAQVELLARLSKRPLSENTEEWKRQYFQKLPKLRRMDAMKMPSNIRLQMPEPF